MAAEKYFPFRSVSGDRKYSAEDWAAYFALFLSDGVCYSSADRLKAVVNEGMKVRVITGAGFIAGRMYMLETDKTITLDTADGALNRIDRIVLRCDYTGRKMGVEVVKGSYSEKPTAPTLTRNADIYELALADVYVPAGAISITQSNITDLRLNTSLCGIVTGLIDQADTTEIFNQFNTYMEEFKKTSGEDFDEQLNEWDKEFNTWFAEIRASLENDLATGLTDRILKLEDGTTPAGNALKLNNKEAKEYMKFVGTVDASFINGYERANPYIAHVSSPTAVELGLPSDYHKILNIPDNADGYATQIAFPANDFTIVPHYRHCGSGIWHDWKVFGDGCNAMTLNGLTADEFVKGKLSFFQEGETILSWALNPNGEYKKMVAGGYYPEDTPTQTEGFVELLYTDSRIKVKYIEYIDRQRIWSRSIFGGTWYNEWTLDKDGGNADTVDGYHASELLKTLGINGAVGGGNAEGDTPNWQDAPDKKQTWYYYESIDTEAYNLPTPYCTVVVNKLNYDRASALAISWTTGEIWSNALWSTWQGWKKGAFADEVLPLTGGTVATTTAIPFNVSNTSGGTAIGIGFFLGDVLQGNIGFEHKKPIYHNPDTDMGYELLHTGNSLKVQASNSNTAPDDDAVWLVTS